jgi:hypothetical protein
MDLNRGVVVAHGAETVLTVSTPSVAPLLLLFHGFDVGAVAKSVRNEIDGDVGADGGRALGIFVVHDLENLLYFLALSIVRHTLDEGPASMINGWVGYQKQLARVFGCLSIVLDSEGTEQLEPTPVD